MADSNRIKLPTDYDERKKWQLWTFLTQYFPDAFLAVVDVAVKGNEQHNPGESMHWAREKSKDQMNTAFRHMWDHDRGDVLDNDGCYHLAKAIWRLSAELQLVIEGENDLPKTETKEAGSVAAIVARFPSYIDGCSCRYCVGAAEAVLNGGPEPTDSDLEL